MKGAMADPWARSSKPRITTVTRMMGSNQNFFRSRRKSQSSARKLIYQFLLKLLGKSIAVKLMYQFLLKLPGKSIAVWPGWCPIDPVARETAFERTAQRVAAFEPEKQRDRREEPEEDNSHHDRIDYSVEQ